MYRYVLFDFDGTVFDTLEGITKSVRYAINKMGMDAPLSELKCFAGPPLLEMFEERFGFTPEKAAQAVRDFRERYVPIGVYESRVFPGVKELLRELRAAGIVTGIATSKPQHLAEELLGKEDLKAGKEYLGCRNMHAAREMIAEKARALLKNVGLAEKESSYPCELSGGQQQRVAIARALALSPDILCFDEPTSALDPELTGEVLKVIRELKTSDRTMIIVTHEISFARDVADTVMFMSDGVIEEMGTPSEVIENPKSERTKTFLSRFSGND